MTGRRVRSVCAAVLASVTLSGCWLYSGGDAGNTRSNPLESTLTVATVGTLTELWSYETTGSGLSEAIVTGDRVFVEHRDPEVQVTALVRSTGAPVWSQSLNAAGDTVMMDQPVTFAGGELWASWAGIPADGDGCASRQVRLDPDDGTIVGDEALPAALRAPAEHEGMIAQKVWPSCGSGDAQLVVRAGDTFATVWTAEQQFWLESPVALSGGHVYVASGSSVYAYALVGCGEPTREPVWTVDLGRHVGQDLVATAGGQLIVTVGPSSFGLTDEQVWSVSAATGAVSWRATLDADHGALATSGDRVFVAPSGTGAGVGTVRAYAADGCGGAATCSPVWSATVGPSAGSPTVAGGVVYVPTTGGAVRAYAADGCGATTCSELATVTVPGDVRGVSVAFGRLFVSSATSPGGALTVFEPR